MARDAPTCVLFRRGPSKWTQLVKWRTNTDSFDAGQRFKGRVYEHWSDLSPDGRFLIYFASKINASTIQEDLPKKPLTATRNSAPLRFMPFLAHYCRHYKPEMKKNNQFEKKVIKPAIKEVRKYRKNHGELPNESVIRELKIQIINPFIRILALTFGLFLLIIGIFSIIDQTFFLGFAFAIVGFVLCIFGFRGKKKKLEGVLEKSDTFGDISLIIEAISLIDW